MPLGYRSTVRPGCRLDSEGPRATGKIRPAARTLENAARTPGKFKFAISPRRATRRCEHAR